MVNGNIFGSGCSPNPGWQRQEGGHQVFLTREFLHKGISCQELCNQGVLNRGQLECGNE